jgi:hypothetical protein
MPLSGYEPDRKQPVSSDVRDPRTRLKVLIILGLLPAAGVALLAPKAIALPLVCMISLMLAITCAIYAWCSQISYRSQGLTFWDLAGMLVLIGLGAGAASEPASALELFGMSATR